jgi:hypothetical protein
MDHIQGILLPRGQIRASVNPIGHMMCINAHSCAGRRSVMVIGDHIALG